MIIEYLLEGQHTFLITRCSFLLGMTNVSDKICRENQNLYFMFNNFFSKILLFLIQCGKIL